MRTQTRFIQSLLPFLFLLISVQLHAQTITVNWANSAQTIDGFGAAAADANAAMPSNLADFLFTSSGINLSILRLQIMPDLPDCQAWVTSLGLSATACVSVSSGPTIMSGEALIAQQAQSRGVSVFFGSSWSPPGSMKSNGVFGQGGNFVGNSTNYANYAAVLAAWPGFMQSRFGIPIFAISPQNEPDISQSYPSALWTAAQFDAFVPYLHSAMVSAGSKSLIILPENAAWSSSYNGFAATAMNDSAAGPHVGMMAQHGYAGDSYISAPATYTYKPSHLWVTEDSSQASSFDGSMNDALGWAKIIHQYLAVANVNAFVWWFASDMPCCGNGTDNAALTDVNGNIAMRAYVTGNWSKFVRPGWHRVGVANSGSLLVTAFANSTGTQSAIVIVNPASTVNNQVFSVGTKMGSSAVPWITSASRNLIQQPPVAVSGGNITYTIPAQSVVTLTNTGIGPAPPTDLTGTVK